MLVATGATVMDRVDPWTTVGGTETAVWICSTTLVPSTSSPNHWPVEGR